MSQEGSLLIGGAKKVLHATTSKKKKSGDLRGRGGEEVVEWRHHFRFRVCMFPLSLPVVRS